MRVKFMKACVVLLVMVVCIEFLVRFRMGVVKVVVAKDTITQRSRISKDDLTYKRVSRHFLSDDVIYKIEDIDGMYLKLEHTLYKGDILRKELVEPIEGIKDAPIVLLDEGERIYTVKREIASIYGNALTRGHYVDVATDEKGVVLEKVKVMSVKDRYGDEVDKGKTPHTILLAVNKESIDILIEVEKTGKLILLPRGMYDAV